MPFDDRAPAGEVAPDSWRAEHRGKRIILVYDPGVGAVQKLLDDLADYEIATRLPAVPRAWPVGDHANQHFPKEYAMTMQRKVLAVMRSSHLHTELVEVTAKVNVIGDAMTPRVEADLAVIEDLARKAMRCQEPPPGRAEPGFGPWLDAESAFQLDFVLCAPIDAAMNRGRIVPVEQVATETVERWGKGSETNDA